MANWYFAENGASTGPVAFEEMKAHLESRRISAATLVWTPDFGSEWKALGQVEAFREVLAAIARRPPPIPAEPAPVQPRNETQWRATEPPQVTRPPMSPPAPVPAAQTYPIYRNQGLGRVLFWLFRIEMLYWTIVAFVPIVSRENGRFSFRTLEEQYRFTLATNSDSWLIVAAIVTLVPAILFLVWTYRLTANVFSLKGPQSITPAGAVYWYFVPVLFLWKPYEAMRNLFAALTPPSAHGQVGVWWGLALTATLIGPIALWVLSPDEVRTLDDARLHVYGTLAINLITAMSVYVGAELVKLLTAADKRALQTAGYP